MDIPNPGPLQAFFFEGLPNSSAVPGGNGAATPDYVAAFAATSDGLALAKTIMRIASRGIRNRIVRLVKEIADSRK
jgi:hypothetical protein